MASLKSSLKKENVQNETHEIINTVYEFMTEESRILRRLEDFVGIKSGEKCDGHITVNGMRFLETASKDLEVKRRLILLQQKVKRLETENTVLKQRLTDIIAGADVEDYMKRNDIANMIEVDVSEPATSSEPVYSSPNTNGNSSAATFKKRGGSVNNGCGLASGSLSPPPPPPVPPRQAGASSNVTSNTLSRTFDDSELFSDININMPSVGTKLEGLLMDELDEDFNPRAYETQSDAPHLTSRPQNSSYNGNPVVPPPLLAPPPKASRDTNRRAMMTSNVKNGNSQKEDIFGSAPFNVVPTSSAINDPTSVPDRDPFGMGDFGIDMVAGSEPTQSDFENAIGLLDKRILEMKDGFSRGLSFGNEDFSLESLDPLRK